VSEPGALTQYRYGRVYIEADRVINPTFPPILVELLGSHVEMLRNVCEYLHRRTTFVAEYGDDFYYTPGDDDWDTIDAIVADLEYRLMPQDNIIWGYHEQWAEFYTRSQEGAGAFNFESEQVPEGYVYVCDLATIANFTGTRTSAFICPKIGGLNGYPACTDVLTRYRELKLTGPIRLAEGDSIVWIANGCSDGDSIRFGVWGYKIKLPE
jgi:hypothetical protein